MLFGRNLGLHQLNGALCLFSLSERRCSSFSKSAFCISASKDAKSSMCRGLLWKPLKHSAIVLHPQPATRDPSTQTHVKSQLYSLSGSISYSQLLLTCMWCRCCPHIVPVVCDTAQELAYICQFVVTTHLVAKLSRRVFGMRYCAVRSETLSHFASRVGSVSWTAQHSADYSGWGSRDFGEGVGWWRDSWFTQGSLRKRHLLCEFVSMCYILWACACGLLGAHRCVAALTEKWMVLSAHGRPPWPFYLLERWPDGLVLPYSWQLRCQGYRSTLPFSSSTFLIYLWCTMKPWNARSVRNATSSPLLTSDELPVSVHNLSALITLRNPTAHIPLSTVSLYVGKIVRCILGLTLF